ncbi:YjgN family protein [Emcibacter sp. SYSU 3D8]|uniref:YjgN family protein n=1 Tax=Emcibacter sp. SYSU 3D8 TaxID=3133969 RepID=UPI0031FE5B85
MSQVLEAPLDAPRHDRLQAGGDGGNLLAIHLMGLLLTIVTLGIYRFWWRTNVRRYLWSSLSYKGDPFEFTGRGLEIFLGFLIVLVLVVAPLMAVYFAGYWMVKSGDMLLGGTIMAATYLVMFALYGAAIYRVMMYRLSRTKWRGIRASLGGSTLRYTGLYILNLVLQIVTLGLATPFTTIMIYRYLLNNVWFGSGRLRFDADWKPLVKYYIGPGILRIVALAIIGFALWQMTLSSGQGDAAERAAVLQGLAVIGIGLLLLLASAIAMYWYWAAVIRTLFAGMEFEGVRFAAPVTGGRYARFMMANFLLVLVTQYIAYPWVQLRILRFVAGVVEIRGEPDFTRISQNTAVRPRFGEGLGEAFL